MAERNYYVICDDNCKFPAMTKEQVLTAIEQVITTGEIKDVDTGFVTTVKEQNYGIGLTFWIGTTAEYNAIETKEKNCFYILTDDTTGEDIKAAIKELREAVETIEKSFPMLAEIVVNVRGGSVICRDANGEPVAGKQTDNVWRFVIPEYGTYTVTGIYGELTETKIIEATAVQQYFVEFNYYSDTFADNDWQTIIEVVQKRITPEGWKAGDTKTLGNQTIRILGKNHDTYTSGGVAPYTFAVVPYTSGATATMTDTSDDINSWSDCIMRTETMPSFISSLPDYVQTALKSVKKYTSAGSMSSEITITDDKAFLLSEVEIYGTATMSFEGEGVQYEFYKNGNNDTIRDTWLRSPANNSNGAHVYTTYSYDSETIIAGTSISTNYHYYFPAFCF